MESMATQISDFHKTLWSEELPVVQFRVARPTDKLKEIKKFYCDGLGLKIISSFEGHSGYSGIMLGLPGREYHLEFTEHKNGSPCPAPTKDNLLVFYIPEKKSFDKLIKRLKDIKYNPVKPENPYWEKNGKTFEDPDGWRVVIMNTAGI